MPTEYFLLCLGRHLKYSCCLYPQLDARLQLGEAEQAMLGKGKRLLKVAAEITLCSWCCSSFTCNSLHQCAPEQHRLNTTLVVDWEIMLILLVLGIELTCQRASLTDGQSVLELGCGWGSVGLFIASKYPNSRVTAVSNSKTQRQFIEGQCRSRNISNLTVLTADVAHFQAPGTYDRVVSVEMFEHMKNYKVAMCMFA